MKELREIIRRFEERGGEPFALATLVRARGSSYRRPGARMLIYADGGWVGSLSGGCLEEEVAQAAQEVIESKTGQLLSFDTRRRFGCNGSIDVFLEPTNEIFLRKLAANLRARRTSLAATVFEDSKNAGSRIVHDGKVIAGALVQKIHPPIRLMLIGHGPDDHSFRALTELLGWELSQLAHISEMPEELDEWTAAVVKSHNYGRDFSALQTLLPRNLRYVGLMGPRRRRDQLLADLFDRVGCMNAELFAPAGLDFGAETPEEIALAIVAEIQSVFAAASRESLRERKAPIHAVRYQPVATEENAVIAR